ncbi:unnamed protein product [Cylicostephanus goldi]|uniref:Core-2/I-Branching enzyme n=1 Tax=Cylicostephanus goldi TaxID=71465 RepID=A0A3P6SZQ4_CYLGO|nr:unnamed protein product [Cylicostephanus goldi]
MRSICRPTAIFAYLQKKLQILFPLSKENIGQHSDWGTFGILDNVYQCFKYLTLRKHNWKYYQYLSGSDLPIRTNLEMVRIMKALNGSINTDGIHPPVPLFKSAMSVAMPRAAANYIVRSTKVRRLLKYLSHTWIPDESFWTSVGGNAACELLTNF